ncbi:hypothetical protein [Aureimonas mangrovi]|uniref:hypothetical protein n=1 Tax=Aureimonas mangrovi TaxID=2758041 RepID=UPI00163D985D|nr:hypothetical protein [Aureimonas mangrovi]
MTIGARPITHQVAKPQKRGSGNGNVGDVSQESRADAVERALSATVRKHGEALKRLAKA